MYTKMIFVFAPMALGLVVGCSQQQQRTPDRSQEKVKWRAQPPESRPGEKQRPRARLVPHKPLELTPFFASGQLLVAQRHLDKGAHREALSALNQALKQHKTGPLAALIKLKLGQCHQALGENDKAYRLFAEVASALPLLGDYARFRAALNAWRAKQVDKVLPMLKAFPSASYLYRDALHLRAMAQAKLGRRLDAIVTLESIVSKRHWPVRLELAQLYEEAGDLPKAIAGYKDLVAAAPGTRWAENAWGRIKALRGKFPKSLHEKLFSLSDAQKLTRAEALFRSHASTRAIAVLTPLISRWPKSSMARCTGLFLIGRSYRKLRKRTKGVPFYEAFAKECEYPTLRVRVLYNAGKDYATLGNEERMTHFFAKLRHEFPHHSYVDDALFRMAKYYLSKGNTKVFRSTVKSQIAAYPNGDMLEHAWWLLIWERYRSKQLKLARRLIGEALKAVKGETTYYSRGRMHYWLGRIEQRQGNKNAAIASYTQCLASYPLSYYAHLAYGRLRELLGNRSEQQLRQAMITNSRENHFTHPLAADLESDRSFRKGVLLLRAGMLRDAQLVFAHTGFLKSPRPAVRWLMARVFHQSGAYVLSHNVLRRKLVDFKRRYPVQALEQYWRVAYPYPFRELLERHAKLQGIPAELALSIMREESGFNPKVESWANALGLMQLLLGTAKGTAKRLDGVGPVTRQRLLEPPLNIRLGTAYLGSLFRRYKHPALAVAGYNAGGGSVKRWLKERGNLPLDEFIEEIPYQQTRNYTKRVIGSFGIYRFLNSGGKEYVRLSFSLPR